MPVVGLPSPQFPTGSGLEIAALGKVYIGQPDTDPSVLANRITVTIVDVNGDEQSIPAASQPFVLNSAGMFTYDGSIVQLRTDQNFSIGVYTAADVLLYYFPDSAITSDVSTSIITLAATTTPAALAGNGKLYAKSVGGGIELMYLDAAGNEVQFTSGGALNVDLPTSNVSVQSITSGYYRGDVVALASSGNAVSLDWQAGEYFTLTNTETTTINFTGAPLISGGIGQTIVLAIQDAGNFAITLSPEAGFTIYVRSVDNPFSLTTDGLDLVFLTVYANAQLLAVPLYNFVALGS